MSPTLAREGTAQGPAQAIMSPKRPRSVDDTFSVEAFVKGVDELTEARPNVQKNFTPRIRSCIRQASAQPIGLDVIRVVGGNPTHKQTPNLTLQANP